MEIESVYGSGSQPVAREPKVAPRLQKVTLLKNFKYVYVQKLQISHFDRVCRYARYGGNNEFLVKSEHF